jgi:translation initiation factor 2B subunit (eIF-2B alpha/beta/delta family)
MTDVTNELLYEILKAVQTSIRKLEDGLGELKQELIAIRGTMVSMQQDINNIYGILARHDQRLDRIERRLELRELAEAQKAFDPTS